MATLLAHIHVRPGTEAQFEKIAAEMYRASHEHEHGLRRYEYWRGAEPGTYYTLESFDDYLGFLRHQTSDHHESANFGEVIADLKLEWVDPLHDASPLVATDMQPLPTGASELEAAYHERFAATVQPWWLPLR